MCLDSQSYEMADVVAEGVYNLDVFLKSISTTKKAKKCSEGDEEKQEFIENLERKLVGARIHFLRSEQGEQPEFHGWARPDASVPNDPELEKFLQSEEESFTKYGFYNLDHARRWAAEHRRMLDKLSFTETGRGKTAHVIIKKQAGVDVERFNVFQNEIEELKITYPYLFLGKRARPAK